jgi:FkbM family methyltransferase
MRKKEIKMRVSDIRVYMDRSKMLSKLLPYIRRTKLVRMYHTYKGVYGKRSNAKKIENFLACYNEHKVEFQKVYNLLEDEESKQTYKAVLQFRRIYEFEAIKKHIYYPQYFVNEILSYDKEIFVDGGAYTGDTIFSFIENVPVSAIEKIYAWEPDKVNGEVCSRNMSKALKNSNVKAELIPCVLYKESTTLKFKSRADDMSKIAPIGGDGTVSVAADTIDNRCPDATFIKMDIEGAEIEALYGAKNTIIANKPKLAICIYHTNEHLYEIPLLIHEWVPEYKLYVRHHGETLTETVLYAIV